MKKFYTIAALILGMAATSQAQFLGMGWDQSTQEIIGRLGMGGYSTLEVGLGLRHDESLDDDNVAEEDLRTTLSASVRYLHALHAWDKFTGYLHAGLYFRDDNNNNASDSPINPFNSNENRASALAVFLGYEPELLLIQHLTVSTRFGLAVPITPDVKVGLVGDGVSIVSGFNFRVLF